MLLGRISSWLHNTTTAQPWAYELSRFTQHRYISETIDIAEGQTENLNPSYQLASGLFCNFFHIAPDVIQ